MTTLGKVLLIILIIILIAGIGIGGFYFKKSSKKGSQGSGQKSSVSQDPNGPYYHQIYSATSKDGLNWEKQNKVLFDHASVPGAVIKDNIIYLYFVDASGNSAQLSVAVSKDLGKTFKKQEAKVEGTESPVDPSPDLLENGQIRLYYFTSPVSGNDPAKAEGKHQIYSADSEDGITFKNPKLAYEDDNLTDPDVFKTANDWRLLVSRGTNLDLAISNDGLSFTKQVDFSWNKGAISDTFNFAGTFRTFYCGQGGIGSATGADSGKLTPEPGVRIQEQNKVVCDPSIIQLPDSSYLMFYKTMDVSQIQTNQPNQTSPTN